MTYLVQTFWIGVMLASLLWSGEHPATLYFAYLFTFLYRVLFLSALSLLPGEALLVRLLTRRPGSGDEHAPMREGNMAGPPAHAGAYAFLIVFLGFLGFIFAHSVDSSDFDVDLSGAMGEFRAASWMALLWLLQEVTGRHLVMDPGKDLSHNLGYNATDAGLLAMTVLTGGFFLMVGEMFGMDRTPWWMVGSLLFYRWLWGVWEDGKRRKDRSGMNGDKDGAKG